METILKLINLEFVRREGQRFAFLQKGIVELLDHELLTLENLIAQRAIDVANANTSEKVSKSKIKKLAKEKVGPAGTVKQMLGTGRRNIVQRVSNEMAHLNGEGFGTQEIRRAIIGTKNQGFSNGILGPQVNGSAVMQRTATTMVNEVASDSERRGKRNVVGYIYVSVLDEGTTLTCADLNGREFYYADGGSHPLPPQHVGCRSTTEDIVKGEPVPEVQGINDFLKGNPEEAREMLGATRYKLWSEGNLRVDRFNDRNFTPLTLDELKQKNAVAFRRAKV